jgi:NAD(P)-dependent dehydrogenase (short-subunit alcohol dehydrogenase family)
MKIFCTGNPERKTIAYGLTNLYPRTMSASLTSGWDFTQTSTIERLKNEILNYDIFVNSAYVNKDIQLILTDVVYKQWIQENIRGHIFNIGTTLENTQDQSEYARTKRGLRKYSIKLSDETGITGIKVSYVCIGGVDNGTPETQGYVKTYEIAKTIEWIAMQKYRIPLIQLDSQKT